MSTKAAPEPVSSLQVQEFEQIYREHAPLVTRTAWEMLSNREDAEDVFEFSRHIALDVGEDNDHHAIFDKVRKAGAEAVNIPIVGDDGSILLRSDIAGKNRDSQSPRFFNRSCHPSDGLGRQ